MDVCLPSPRAASRTAAWVRPSVGTWRMRRRLPRGRPRVRARRGLRRRDVQRARQLRRRHGRHALHLRDRLRGRGLPRAAPATHHDDGMGGCTDDVCVPSPCTVPNRGVCSVDAGGLAGCGCDAGFHDDGAMGCTTDPCTPSPCAALGLACRVTGGVAECYTPVCNDGNPCTDAYCVEGGRCVYPVRADGVSCSTTLCPHRRGLRDRRLRRRQRGLLRRCSRLHGRLLRRDLRLRARERRRHRPERRPRMHGRQLRFGRRAASSRDGMRSCDDARWCTGVKRCMPTAAGADARRLRRDERPRRARALTGMCGRWGVQRRRDAGRPHAAPRPAPAAATASSARRAMCATGPAPAAAPSAPTAVRRPCARARHRGPGRLMSRPRAHPRHGALRGRTTFPQTAGVRRHFDLFLRAQDTGVLHFIERVDSSTTGGNPATGLVQVFWSEQLLHRSFTPTMLLGVWDIVCTSAAPASPTRGPTLLLPDRQLRLGPPRAPRGRRRRTGHSTSRRPGSRDGPPPLRRRDHAPADRRSTPTSTSSSPRATRCPPLLPRARGFLEHVVGHRLSGRRAPARAAIAHQSPDAPRRVRRRRRSVGLEQNVTDCCKFPSLPDRQLRLGLPRAARERDYWPGHDEHRHRRRAVARHGPRAVRGHDDVPADRGLRRRRPLPPRRGHGRLALHRAGGLLEHLVRHRLSGRELRREQRPHD